MRYLVLLLLTFYSQKITGLDNGVALTPPMGWMSWQRFRCLTDCLQFPNECISDKLIRRIADKMVDDGYLAVGYEYIVIDDCWLEKNRDAEGNLVEDRERFPYGMKALSDYVHNKGLKFGIYQDIGAKTCAGYPGMYNNVNKDISKFVEWNIDYIKIDGCNHNVFHYPKDYEDLQTVLNETGRPIVYSCSYPAYQQEASISTNYEQLIKNCNLWRFFDDIDDSWKSVTTILDFYADKQDQIAKYAGPGHWNDPDMLVIGNYGLSHDQSKVQMALWAILAAPLLMSVDLQSIKPEYKAILLNKKIIDINQDPLGIQGLRVFRQKGIEVWTRKINPIVFQNHSYAIAIYSQRTDGLPYVFEITLKDINLHHSAGYIIEDLFEDKIVDSEFLPNSNVTVRINPTGAVFLKATCIEPHIVVSV